MTEPEHVPASDVEIVGAAPRWTAYMPVEAIARAAVNPKMHATSVIETSIDRFGFVEPMTLDERTGRLVAGHGRLDALLAADSDGETPEGCVRGAGGELLAPVSRGWASRDDAEAEAYLIASNRTTEIGGWDPRALAPLLERVEATSSLIGTGYTSTDLAALLERNAGPDAPEEFPTFDDGISTEFRCPKCEYEWSGRPK